MKEVVEDVPPPARIAALPFGLASFEAFFLELLPNPLLTRDQVRLLRQDAIAAPGVPGLAELGIAPTVLELILPAYLERYRRAGRMAGIRLA